MTSRLSAEFKREASEHILYISKELISKYFDKEPGLKASRSFGPKPAIVDNDRMKVEISRYFIDNKPKWGSVEYWMNEWYENKKYFKNLSDFLSKNKTYMTDKEFSNVKQNLTII